MFQRLSAGSETKLYIITGTDDGCDEESKTGFRHEAW